MPERTPAAPRRTLDQLPRLANGLGALGRIDLQTGGKTSQPPGRQIGRAAEDFADEANYQYRRLRRQVNRHPAATVAIVAGTIGAFLLLRRAFGGRDED